MGDPSDFADNENWHGFYYELAIDLGLRSDVNSDERVASALAAMWADPRLDGCYLDGGSSRSNQQRTAPVITDTIDPSPLYGVAQLPTGGQVVCVTHIIRELETEGSVAHDWLDLCLTTGALGRIDPRVNDDESPAPELLEPIDSWFVEVAQRVFDSVRFRYALIGVEVSGSPFGDEVDPPTERSMGYIKVSDDGLRFYPANRE